MSWQVEFENTLLSKDLTDDVVWGGYRLLYPRYDPNVASPLEPPECYTFGSALVDSSMVRAGAWEITRNERFFTLLQRGGILPVGVEMTEANIAEAIRVFRSKYAGE